MPLLLAQNHFQSSYIKFSIFSPYPTHLSGTAICIYSRNEAVSKHFAPNSIKEEESQGIMTVGHNSHFESQQIPKEISLLEYICTNLSNLHKLIYYHQFSWQDYENVIERRLLLCKHQNLPLWFCFLCKSFLCKMTLP